MRSPALLAAAILLAVPAAAWAEGGPGTAGVTQSRTGLGTADHPTNSPNSLPAGSENATTGPQSQPAYPSGSTTANPGAAFVRTGPVPATGPAAAPPGIVSTTPGAAAATTEGAGVAPAKP